MWVSVCVRVCVHCFFMCVYARAGGNECVCVCVCARAWICKYVEYAVLHLQIRAYMYLGHAHTYMLDSCAQRPLSSTPWYTHVNMLNMQSFICRYLHTCIEDMHTFTLDSCAQRPLNCTPWYTHTCGFRLIPTYAYIVQLRSGGHPAALYLVDNAGHQVCNLSTHKENNLCYAIHMFAPSQMMCHTYLLVCVYVSLMRRSSSCIISCV